MPPDPARPSALALRATLTRTGRGATFSLDIALEAPAGVTILFGPSGSGKSTALQIAAGLLRPDRGRVALGAEVWFDSEQGIDLAVERRRIAFVFQSLALFPHMTALANVMYGIDRDQPRDERVDRAHAMLKRLSVDHLAHRRPRTFSGGEAQRVALARALATEPRVILLDEPFSALDRDLRIELARLVRELVDDLGVPAIHVTHSHNMARAMGDHIVRMRAGRVVAEGKLDEVLPRQGEDRDATPMPELRKP
jgi:molybdate transport system ATP-binding protein